MTLSSWYEEHVVPRLIRCACSSPAIARARAMIVPLAHGRVLEIGCGGGLNQSFYQSSRIGSYAGIDPSAKGLAFARAAAAGMAWSADFRQNAGEAIPFETAAFDTAVCTFTLCSVSDPPQVLRELRRILRPGGQLLFAEHGLAPDARVRTWQARIEPVWKRLAGGCHLSRPVTSAIAQAGFDVASAGQHYAPGMPRWAGWLEWGSAIKTN